MFTIHLTFIRYFERTRKLAIKLFTTPMRMNYERCQMF